MAIDKELIEELMRTVRVKSQCSADELSALAESCVKDLEIAGDYVTDEKEPLSKQAIKLYCKANYGYDKESEKFKAAYVSLRDSMALSGDYGKRGGSDG